MSAPAPSHDLLVGPASVTGTHSDGLDLELCADIARTVAQSARAWAGDATWTGLGGFDASGGFWLGPVGPLQLGFVRTPRCEGWLRPLTEAEPAPDSLAARFPAGAASFLCDAPLPFPLIESRVRALQGFGGCALRHPVTGLWKPVIAPADPARLGVATRAFTPLSRILSSQGLPVGRLLIISARSAALVWRTPRKIYGYLHLHELGSLPAAVRLVDSLLLCTSVADQD